MAMTLITTNTSSGAATSDFTSGIDSTYKLYIFKFYDVNPDTDSIDFSFQANASGQSGFNETMTTTYFRTNQMEDDSSASVDYQDWIDQAQGTAYQFLNYDTGSDADQSSVGELFLFNPSNTTYVKHFYSTSQASHYADATQCHFVAGYINTTSAIDEISFKMASGNFDGTIKMYGVG